MYEPLYGPRRLHVPRLEEQRESGRCLQSSSIGELHACSKDMADNPPTSSSGAPPAANPPLSNAASAGAGPAMSSATMVVTTTQPQPQQRQEPVLRLQLRPQSNVSWDADVVDNEGMGRKSSKRCCIWHKQRAFGESSTESDDGDDGSTSSSSSGGGGSGKAQRPVTKKKNRDNKRVGVRNDGKIPDFQRFHA